MSEEAVEYGRCPVCGYLMLPVLEMSPCGHDASPELLSLVAEGTVYSWTRVGLGENALMVMADFFDGSLRVTASLEKADTVSIGDRVRLITGGDKPYVLRPAG